MSETNIEKITNQLDKYTKLIEMQDQKKLSKIPKEMP